jgi:hypothetical protein
MPPNMMFVAVAASSPGSASMKRAPPVVSVVTASSYVYALRPSGAGGSAGIHVLNSCTST